jgi:hypothetical protein
MSSFGHRPSVEELLAAYEIDQGLVNPRPRWIGVFDDVLTAGTHFSSDEEHTAAQLSRGSSLRFSSRAASSLTRLISAVVTLFEEGQRVFAVRCPACRRPGLRTMAIVSSRRPSCLLPPTPPKQPCSNITYNGTLREITTETTLSWRSAPYRAGQPDGCGQARRVEGWILPPMAGGSDDPPFKN